MSMVPIGTLDTLHVKQLNCVTHTNCKRARLASHRQGSPLATGTVLCTLLHKDTVTLGVTLPAVTLRSCAAPTGKRRPLQSLRRGPPVQSVSRGATARTPCGKGTG